MTINVGDRLPDTTFMTMSTEGPKPVQTAEVLRFPAGGSLERDLVSAIVAAVLARGWIALVRDRRAVLTAAVTEVIRELKEDSRYAAK